MNQKVSDSFTERIQQFVSKVKADEEARGEYMIESLAIQDSKREGKREGRQEKAIEVAINLKKAGVDINTIAQCVGLPVEEIEKL